MANLVKFNAAYGTLVAIFSNTDLASLASGSWTFGSGAGVAANAYDNTTGLHLWADFQILLGSFTPGSTPYVSLAALHSMDGTNYPDPQAAAAPPAGTPVYTGGVTAGASAKIITIPNVLLKPGKTKFMFGNNTGAILAATANSGSLFPPDYTNNG
jgi:hypothetical protein